MAAWPVAALPTLPQLPSDGGGAATLALAGLAALLAGAGLAVCCAPCLLQLPCSRCFRARRRRAKPDHEAVPPTPQFDAAWLTAALRRGSLGPKAAAHRVCRLTHSEIAMDVDDGGEVLNGGGLAGGRTVRVSGIAYEPAVASAAAPRRDQSQAEPLPSSLIAKCRDDLDVVGGSKDHPDSLVERLFVGWLLGLRSAQDKAMIHEVRFYESLAEELVAATGLRLPAVYYSGKAPLQLQSLPDSRPHLVGSAPSTTL